MGEISAFVIGGIVGIVISSVGAKELVVIIKEEAIPIFLTLVEGII
jgi:hypothetical protein